ncbi:MAG: serine hydrolase [Gammaproteobacteria bacterium]|nr:serine hydrolase [Gammaproteobacteria bacterium]
MATEINGLCDDGFLPIRKAFASNFDDNLELGASVAVTHQGSLVVDLWAGSADRRKTRPWQEDTIVNVFSTTKVTVILCILKLVSEGKIDLDAPVARYWPEFGQAGKSDVTVRQTLIHRAGVPGFSEVLSFEALNDYDHLITLIAHQKPWFDDPGTTCYHSDTFGLILGEVTRRVTGKRISEYFHDEIAGPATADFHIGIRERSVRDRLAQLVFPENAAASIEPGSVGAKVMQNFWPPDYQRWERQQAEFPSGNGYGNARSLAQVGAIAAMSGEVGGIRYISEEIMELATTEQSYSECPLMGMLRLGLGFGLHSKEFPAPTPSCFHWGGFGGSSCVMDMQTGISFGYTPNRLGADRVDSDPRLGRLWQALAAVITDL